MLSGEYGGEFSLGMQYDLTLTSQLERSVGEHLVYSPPAIRCSFWRARPCAFEMILAGNKPPPGYLEFSGPTRSRGRTFPPRLLPRTHAR